jgi:hypothetical protein
VSGTRKVLGAFDGLLTSARKGAGYLGRPALLAAKVARVWRRRRSEQAYRDALAGGGLIVVPPSPPAEVLFTVATPVHRVAEEHLRAAIASVRAQTYPLWELLLLDDASPDPHVARVLAEAVRGDGRIRTMRRTTNGGIAVASNEILRQARGEYVAFLDHDDLLHPRALELAARFFASCPGVEWLFTDEDKIDEGGRHHEPCLKPGWSHHLLLSFNYVSHLRIVRRALLERLGGHREGFEGAQDYDLALRAVAAGARFAHLRGVLYHWRTVASSMARVAGAKPQAHAHALRALAQHAGAWPRGGAVTADVLLGPASLFRVRREPDRGLAVAVLEGDPAAGSLLIEAARRSAAEIVVLPPPGGVTAADMHELLALLQVPGTAIAGGRGVAGSRVVASGFVVGDDRRARDPGAGLRIADPGYLNLALIPGPREVPPPLGWAGWRDLLIAAWDATADAPTEWRLGTGLARAGLEVVTTPMVSFAWPPARRLPLPTPAPAELSPRWSHWLDELRLA